MLPTWLCDEDRSRGPDLKPGWQAAWLRSEYLPRADQSGSQPRWGITELKSPTSALLFVVWRHGELCRSTTFRSPTVKRGPVYLAAQWKQKFVCLFTWFVKPCRYQSLTLTEGRERPCFSHWFSLWLFFKLMPLTVLLTTFQKITK